MAEDRESAGNDYEDIISLELTGRHSFHLLRH